MIDTLRRMIGGDVRPVDVWVIVIEVLVLLWIVFDSTWDKVDRFRTRHERKQSEKRMLLRLAALRPEERSALRDLVLQGRQPNNQIIASIQSKIFEVITRDFIGWHVPDEHKRFLMKWAKKL